MNFILKKIVVFFGGVSTEREISVITGVLTLNSLDKAIYEPVPVFIDKNGTAWSGEPLFNLNFYKKMDFKKLYKVNFIIGNAGLFKISRRKNKEIGQIYCAINCMHGICGEDGMIAGLMKACNIPLASPDMFSSSLSIDKHLTKLILVGIKVPCVDYIKLERENFFSRSEASIKYVGNKLGFPVIVKPARLGSSIGIKKVNDATELFPALCEAFNFDDKVLAEKYLPGARDINCAVYKDVNGINVSETEEAFTVNEILSFEDKYGGSKITGEKRRFPADIEEARSDDIKFYSKTVYKKLGFSGIVRFDFLLHNGEVYLNEINSVPGSLAYYLFCNKISEFSDLLHKIIVEAINNHKKELRRVMDFESNVLSGNWEGIKK